MRHRERCTVTLTPEAIRLLTDLARRTGMSRSAIVDQCVRLAHRAIGDRRVTITTEGEDAP